MTDVFARAGEPVTTQDGRVICYLKNDLRRHQAVSAGDFERFATGEDAWRAGEPIDYRCVRANPDRPNGLQICINGEWRP